MKNLWRIYNETEQRFFVGHRGRSTWAHKHYAVTAFKTRHGQVHPDDHPNWEVKEFKLVEVSG
ncbi:MAG: hypothetical protein GY799_20930 [Desulfobulbaceae bacterium]|nr:hypothetical protein [Desulfobulbaceae bacterium]